MLILTHSMLLLDWILDTKMKHFPRYWPFVRGIHRSPLNSPQKGQWRGALMFSLICAWINGLVNNRDAVIRDAIELIMMSLWGWKVTQSWKAGSCWHKSLVTWSSWCVSQFLLRRNLFSKDKPRKRAISKIISWQFTIRDSAVAIALPFEVTDHIGYTTAAIIVCMSYSLYSLIR